MKRNSKLWKVLSLVVVVAMVLAVMGATAFANLAVTIDEVTWSVATRTIYVDYTVTYNDNNPAAGHQTTVMMWNVAAAADVNTPFAGSSLSYVNQFDEATQSGTLQIRATSDFIRSNMLYALWISGEGATAQSNVGIALVNTEIPVLTGEDIGSAAYPTIFGLGAAQASRDIVAAVTGGDMSEFTLALDAGASTLPDGATVSFTGRNMIVTAPAGGFDDTIANGVIVVTVTDYYGDTTTVNVYWAVDVIEGPPVYDIITLASDLFADLDGEISWMTDHSAWSRVIVRIDLGDETYADFVPNISGATSQYWFWSPQLQAFDGLVEWTPASAGDVPTIEFEPFTGDNTDRTIAFYGAYTALDSDDVVTMADVLVAVGLWNGMLVDGNGVAIDITPQMLLSFDVAGTGEISLNGLLDIINFWNGTTSEMVSELLNTYGR
ncbi:MAG: hypothetical protein FWE04_02400 [Oscillospiraceae bacterium]|nr:hypothetical protein [Oscillospiraceae bacterium]